MHDTSKLGDQQRTIYDFIGEAGKISRQGVAEKMGRTADSIGQTFTALRRMGLIRQAERIKVITADMHGMWVILWEHGRCPTHAMPVYSNPKWKPPSKRISRSTSSGQSGRKYIPEFKPLRRDIFEKMRQAEESR